MGASHDYWLTTCDPATLGAAVLAATGAGAFAGVETGMGACGQRAVVKVAAGTEPPAGVEALSHADWAAPDTGRQYSAGWVKAMPQEWTGTEKAVLVPVAEGTADHVAHLAAGWAACEYHDGARLVRYTGTKPAALAAYATLYAADVAALLGGA